jgi:hypothetical protein
LLLRVIIGCTISGITVIVLVAPIETNTVAKVDSPVVSLGCEESYEIKTENKEGYFH